MLTVSEETRPGMFRRALYVAVCLALLTAIFLAVFGQAFLRPDWPWVNSSGDYRKFYGPMTFLLDFCMARGELPLWNPLVLCGMPFAADPQNTLFYPPHLLRGLVFFDGAQGSTHLGITAMLLFHVLLGALGTMALARSYRLSWPAAFAAAVAYMLAPNMVRRMLDAWTLMAVAAYTPWLLYFVKRALDAHGRAAAVRFTLMAALTLGLSVLAGFPQITYYTLAMLGLFVLLDRLLAPGLQAWWLGLYRWQRTARVLYMLAGLGLVAGCLAMVQLLPTAEFIPHASRATVDSPMNIQGEDFSLLHQLQCLVIYPGAVRVEKGIRAAGMISLLLLLMAFTHRNWKPAALFAVLYVLFMDAALGPPFPMGILFHLGDVMNFGSPWRAGVVGALPLAMLAGFGIDAVTERWRRQWGALLRIALAALAACGMGYVAYTWFAAEPFFPVSPWILTIPGAGLIALVAAAAAPKPARWGRPVLALLLCLEIAVWNGVFTAYYFDTRAPVRNPEAPETFWHTNERSVDSLYNTAMYDMEAVMNGYNPLYLGEVRQLLAGPGRALSYSRFVRWYEPLTQNSRGLLLFKRDFWLASRYVAAPMPGRDTHFPPTQYVYLPEEPDTPLRVERATNAAVPRQAVSSAYEARDLSSDGAAPAALRGRRATRALAHYTPEGRHSALVLWVTANTAGTIELQFRGNEPGEIMGGRLFRVGPSSEAVRYEFPAPDYAQITPVVTWESNNTAAQLNVHKAEAWIDKADEQEHIQSIERTANGVTVELAGLPAPRILVHLDSGYPGWKAYVDGVETPILPAHHAFKGVEVSQGDHTVRFEYRPHSVIVGASVSLITLGLVLLAILICAAAEYGRARRRSRC